MAEAKATQKHSLVELTREFILMLSRSNGSEVDLVDAENQIGVSKRRLYDVTNVLAGVGLVERCGKSKVRWIGDPSSIDTSPLQKQMAEKEQEIDKMTQTVDQYLDDLSKSEIFRTCAWVTQDDIANLVSDSNISLFALRGPPDMTIQIEGPEENSPYHLICSSADGQIDLIPIGHREDSAK